MERLEVFAADVNMVRLTGPIEYAELVWDRAYYEPGAFSLTIPSALYSPEWAYVIPVGRPEVGVVERVAQADSSDVRGGVDSVTVSGRFAECRLASRVLVPERVTGWGVAGDPADTYVRWAEQVFGPEFDRYAPPSLGLEAENVTPEEGPFADAMYASLAPLGVSPRVSYDWESDTWEVTAWRGLDRTQGQTDVPWAVFDDEWGTLTGYEAVSDSSAYRNACLVRYDYDEPNSWDDDGAPYLRPVYEWNDTGTARVLVGWYVPYARRRGILTARIEDGLPDIEAYLDKSDEKPEGDSSWSRGQYPAEPKPTLPPGLRASYLRFPSQLMAEGIRKLVSEHPMVETLDTGVLSDAEYMSGWDLGDMVEAAAHAVGISVQARITRATEVHGDTSYVAVAMGDQVIGKTERR